MSASVTARSGLASGIRPGRAGSVVIALSAAAVGFLLVGQLQGPRAQGPPLEAESEGDLARILADLNTEADALQGEIADLKVQLNELRRSSRSDEAAAAAAAQQLRTLEVLSGTVPVSGPGVVVTIGDPNAVLTYDVMIDVVQELRDAGAEALAVNDLRIGASTAFAEADGRVTVGGRVVTPPFRVVAIGQPATLEGGLKIPGGAIDTVSALKGVAVEVAKQARVVVPALERPPSLGAARPSGR